MCPPIMTSQLDLFEDDPERIVSKAEAKPMNPEFAACTRCAERYLTVDEVAARFSTSRATIWRWIKNNPQFPKPIKVSLGATRWKQSTLVRFEAQILAERDACQSVTAAGTLK
jgi:predicted DNA-binding transcriptional regulator AlpA